MIFTRRDIPARAYVAMYNFKGHLSAFAELDMMLGFGNTALIVDLNLGLLYRIGS